METVMGFLVSQSVNSACYCKCEAKMKKIKTIKKAMHIDNFMVIFI